MKTKTLAIDLDGTLANWNGWVDPTEIGAPVPEMVSMVKRWISEGHTVWIFTARMNAEPHLLERIEAAIKQWCILHIGLELPITGKKLLGFTTIYDDRARHIIPNTGKSDMSELINRFALMHIKEEWILRAITSLNKIHEEIHEDI